MSDYGWETFTRQWLIAMVGFQDGSLSMEQALGLIEEASEDIDNEIEQIACNILSEVSGFPTVYAETMELLKGGPTKSAVLDFMNS